jgi:hypothetical protein
VARARVAAAFRKLAHGVDPRTAGDQDAQLLSFERDGMVAQP